MYLVGPSLGGCVAVHVAAETDIFDGCLLLAPMMSLEQLKRDKVNSILLPVASCLSAMVPKLRLVSESENRFPEEAAYIDADALCDHVAVRVRVGVECLNGVSSAREKASHITCPLLVFHSSNDTMVDPEGM